MHVCIQHLEIFFINLRLSQRPGICLLLLKLSGQTHIAVYIYRTIILSALGELCITNWEFAALHVVCILLHEKLKCHEL